MFEYCLCSCPRGRDPSPQRRQPSSSPVYLHYQLSPGVLLHTPNLQPLCLRGGREHAVEPVLPAPVVASRRAHPAGRTDASTARPHPTPPPTAAPHLQLPTSPASLPVSGRPPSAGRPGRVSSYTSTGASRVVSVASPFTTYSVECTDMPVSRAARPVDLREAGAKDRRPVLPQGAAHYAGVRRPLSIRHWSGRVRSFCAPRRIALKGCYWCSDAGVSIWRPVAGGIPCPPPAAFRRRVIIDVSMPAFRSDVRFQRSQIESV